MTAEKREGVRCWSYVHSSVLGVCGRSVCPGGVMSDETGAYLTFVGFGAAGFLLSALFPHSVFAGLVACVLFLVSGLALLFLIA
jgi:hypothetical protein